MGIHKHKKRKKKGLIIGMLTKTLVPKKTAPGSIMSKRSYKVFISNPAKKGSSLMSMAKYNQDSGVVKNEFRKSNNG